MYTTKEAKVLLQDKTQEVKNRFGSKTTDGYLKYVIPKRAFLLSDTGALDAFFGVVY